LHTDAKTIWGGSIGTAFASANCYNREVIRTLAEPANPVSGIWVLKGNLCPNGAVMKPSARQPLAVHAPRPRRVFESIEDLHARIDAPDLEVDANSVLVLKGCGPKGYPGMPEVGNMPLPRKLLEQGVSDMLRISDARMSGTAFGTVVLHVAPEAEAVGRSPWCETAMKSCWTAQPAPGTADFRRGTGGTHQQVDRKDTRRRNNTGVTTNCTCST